MSLRNRIRRLLGRRPILVLYTGDNEASRVTTPILRLAAEQNGYRVKERRI